MEGGLNPKYVLDEMEQYEIAPLIKGISKKNKESWEQTRLIAYITAQTQSTKKLKITDIIKFPWDDEKNDVDTAVSNEDINRLTNKANLIKEKLYGK
jgi:hypothetical protein